MDGLVPSDSFWGKLSTAPDGRTVAWHPLVDHCIDVAAVFESLVELPSFSRVQAACRWEPLCRRQKVRLSVIAFLHDIGKCNWGFQSKRDSQAAVTAGHVMEAAALFWDDPTVDLWPVSWRDLLVSISGWFVGGPDHAEQMLLAAISHHGRPVSRNDYKSRSDRNISRWWKPHGELNPLRGLEAFVETARTHFPAAFDTEVDPIDANPAFQQRFAGLVMLADWVGSDTGFFPYREHAREDRASLARHHAERAIAAIGLTPPGRRESKPFATHYCPVKNRAASVGWD